MLIGVNHGCAEAAGEVNCLLGRIVVSQYKKGAAVTLTKTERVMLMNQYLILAELNASDADSYRRHAKALSSGYTSEYEFLEHMSDELPEDQCDFVSDVLNMYDGLQASFKNLPSTGTITAAQVKYKGFGGNEEVELMSYSRFIVDETDRWTYLDLNKDHNSHALSSPGYRRMLAKWKEFGESYELDAAQLKAVIDASRYPGE